MPLRRRLFVLPLLHLSAAIGAAQDPGAGRDWFVRAPTTDASAGDGSRGAPFHDPWQALARCEAGDRVHVAAGSYHGRLGRGTWVVSQPRVQLLAGYDAQFTERDPWRHQTRLAHDATSKNWPRHERLRVEQPGVTVDGLVLDMQDQCPYVDETHSARADQSGESAVRCAQPATVRNCILVNPGRHGIASVGGSTIENNVVVNAIVWAIVVDGGDRGERIPTTVRGNTVLFAWDPDKPGAGGYGGSAVAVRGPATIADNVLGHCDNAAIYAVVDPAGLQITGNVFWQNRFANLTAELGSQRAVVGDRDLELLEDLGLAAHQGNRVADPEVPFDAKSFARGFAAACDVTTAIGMLRSEASDARVGARRQQLPKPVFVAAPATSPTPTYHAAPLASWNREPAAVAGQRVEMIVAVGGVANVAAMPSQYPKDHIAGVFLYADDGSGERLTGFYRTGTSVERTLARATGGYQGQGTPERRFVVRGLAHATTAVPKGALLVETIEPYEPAATLPPRPRGRDWFVRAGASGGDGTREKPFRDPFQALERCTAGDSIHVATGEYTGKSKAGRWTIEMPHVALLGGYDAEFTRRDPWQQPTRLLCPTDFRGRRVGYTLAGGSDHTGAIVDGFVFDKRGDNVYGEGGGLDVGQSDKTEHLWLSRPGCELRNCVFVNGAAAAVRLASAQIVENCVFVNHVGRTVVVERGHGGAPFVFRDNTALFAWSTRFGQGRGASGNLLRLTIGVRAEIVGNRFGYADNDAVQLATAADLVTLRDNAFAHNLWSNVQQMGDNDAVDDASMPWLADLGLRAASGNRVDSTALPIDPTWLAAHQAVRAPTAATAAEAVQVPTKPKPEANPFDDPSAALPPPPKPRDDDPFADPAPAAGTASEGFAMAYDWQQAIALVPPTAPVGARRRDLPVVFSGHTNPTPPEEATYESVAWETARSGSTWQPFVGKRVQLEVAIQRSDNQYRLADVGEADYACYLVGGRDGVDSGLPLRCYVRRGTEAQRVFERAKGQGTGKATEMHVLRGVAHTGRQIVVDSAAKAR